MKSFFAITRNKKPVKKKMVQPEPCCSIETYYRSGGLPFELCDIEYLQLIQ